MSITTGELARIRAAAVGDMLGDSKALDEMGPAATVFRLCQEIKRLEREANWLAIIAFDGTAGLYDYPERLVEAAREAVGEGEESCPKN